MALYWHHVEQRFIEVEAPTSWSPELVAARLIEAAKVAASTSHPVRSPGSGWPAILREYEDLIGRGAEARAEVWTSWASVRPSYSAETHSRALEALRWPSQYLHDQEGACRVVTAWATAKAGRVKLTVAFRRRGWSMSTVKAKRRVALDRISAGLNANRIPIREAQVFVD